MMGTLEKDVGHIEENTIEFTEKGNIELVGKTAEKFGKIQ